MNLKTKPILLVLLFLLVLAVGTAVLAQSSASFDLSWHAIGSGGSESSSASYRVNGTIGQSAASPPVSANTNFAVNSGYWYGGYRVYLPVTLKN